MAPISTPGRAEPVNGIEMYYETRGEGEPLVLLHGGGGVGANWDLIFKVPPQGYQLIIPDLRGHGRSTNPLPGFTFRQFRYRTIVWLRVERQGVASGLWHVGSREVEAGTPGRAFGSSLSSNTLPPQKYSLSPTFRVMRAGLSLSTLLP